LVTDALADYLEQTVRRPRGALTPLEAESGIAGATRDAALGTRVGRLIAVCDRVRYSDGESSAAELVAEARRLFAEVSRKTTPPAGAPESVDAARRM
jgi:hypothetical protein